MATLKTTQLPVVESDPFAPGWEDEDDLSECLYYRGEGTCSFGCHSEPACMTERPSDGWPSERPVIAFLKVVDSWR